MAGVRDTGYKDWTPRINAVGIGYSGTNGVYAGFSFDGGAHMNNFGYNNGFTLGSSAYGNTTMGRVSNVNDPYLYVIQREQEMRNEYFANKGMEITNEKLQINWLDDIMKWGIDPASNLTTAGAGLRYTSSNFLREGYWQGVNGRYYSMSLTQEGTKGWVLYKSSANIANNSVKWLGRFGNGLGYLNTLYTGTKLVADPSLSNGVDFGVGLASIAFWEVGAVYYGGKTFYELTRYNNNYLMNSGFNPGMQFIINKE